MTEAEQIQQLARRIHNQRVRLRHMETFHGGGCHLKTIKRFSKLALARKRIDAQKELNMEYRYVPLEPTPAMIDAAVRKAEQNGATDFVAIWKAMLDAAPRQE